MDLNTATFNELLTLYGVAHQRATNIIQMRTTINRPLTMPDILTATGLPKTHVERWILEGNVLGLPDVSESSNQSPIDMSLTGSIDYHDEGSRPVGSNVEHRGNTNPIPASHYEVPSHPVRFMNPVLQSMPFPISYDGSMIRNGPTQPGLYPSHTPLLPPGVPVAPPPGFPVGFPPGYVPYQMGYNGMPMPPNSLPPPYMSPVEQYTTSQPQINQPNINIGNQVRETNCRGIPVSSNPTQFQNGLGVSGPTFGGPRGEECVVVDDTRRYQDLLQCPAQRHMDALTAVTASGGDPVGSNRAPMANRYPWHSTPSHPSDVKPLQYQTPRGASPKPNNTAPNSQLRIVSNAQDIPPPPDKARTSHNTTKDRHHSLTGGFSLNNNKLSHSDGHSSKQRRSRYEHYRSGHNNDLFSSSDESPSSSNSSPGEYSQNHRRREHHHQERPIRRRSPSPINARMSTFHGDVSRWKPFIISFKQIAKRRNWNKHDRLGKLLQCMRDNAICYVDRQPRQVQGSYRLLLETLEKRYGRKDPPSTYRRGLNAIRQREEEEIDDFADRVYETAAEGFPDAEESLIQSLSSDAFLRGCRDRNAAYMASEKSNETLTMAVRHLRASQNNLKNLGARPNMRQVTFKAPTSPGRDTSDPPAGMLQGLQQTEINLEILRLLKSLDQRLSFQGRRGTSRSPSPNFRGNCFNCQRPGHYSRDCPNNKSSSPRQCFSCGSRDHLSRDCIKTDSTSPQKHNERREPNLGSRPDNIDCSGDVPLNNQGLGKEALS